METGQENSRRKIYLDILRIIACFLVLLCHTISFTYNSKLIEDNWFISNSLYYISKIAVPIFFMISGALMLRKDIDYRQIAKKIFFRLLIPLIVISIIIYFKRTPTFSLENIINFIKEFFNAEILLPLWFLYSLIGMYICTPFLRKMVKNMENRDFKIFFAIWVIVTGIVPIIFYYAQIKITNYFIIPIIGRYIPYYLLGYYMFERNEIKTSKKILIAVSLLGLISLIFSVVLTYFDIKVFGKETMFLDKVDYINLIIMTFSVCYIVKYIFENRNFSEKVEKMILSVSSTTFGIYIIHGVLIGHFQFIYNNISRYLGTSIGIILHNLIFFAILSCIIYIIRKIPYVNKFI